MKKAIIVGAIVAGAIAAGVAAWLIIINVAAFKPKEGITIPANDYSQYVTGCYNDAIFSFSDGVDARDEITYPPQKTDYYTEDGYPVWVFSWIWKRVEDGSPVSYQCRIGTTSNDAYAIDLRVNAELKKTYSEANLVDEKGREI